MADFRPTVPFSSPMELMRPTYSVVNGVQVKSYETSEPIQFFGSFQTYGGTEKTVNGLYSIEDTANITTWYMPEMKGDCRIRVLNTGAVYDVIGEPENINLRNQFLKFKVRRVKGGA